MSSIISIRDSHNKDRMFVWLKENSRDYIATRASVTFWNDEDAVAFMLAFGVENATYNPEILNCPRPTIIE